MPFWRGAILQRCLREVPFKREMSKGGAILGRCLREKLFERDALERCYF